MKVVIIEKENENEIVIGGVTYIPIDTPAGHLHCDDCYFAEYHNHCELTNIHCLKCFKSVRKDHRNIVWKLKDKEE